MKKQKIINKNKFKLNRNMKKQKIINKNTFKLNSNIKKATKNLKLHKNTKIKMTRFKIKDNCHIQYCFE